MPLVPRGPMAGIPGSGDESRPLSKQSRQRERERARDKEFAPVHDWSRAGGAERQSGGMVKGREKEWGREAGLGRDREKERGTERGKERARERDAGAIYGGINHTGGGEGFVDRGKLGRGADDMPEFVTGRTFSPSRRGSRRRSTLQ